MTVESFLIIRLTISGIGFSCTFPLIGCPFSISSLKKISSYFKSSGRPVNFSSGAKVMRQRAHMASLRWKETSFADFTGDVFSRIALKMLSNVKVVSKFSTILLSSYFDVLRLKNMQKS